MLCVRAAADAVARLEHDDVREPRAAQVARRGESGNTGADDRHVEHAGSSRAGRCAARRETQTGTERGQRRSFQEPSALMV